MKRDDIRERERQLAARRPHVHPEKTVHGDCATQLVTVRDGVDHDVRSGMAAVESGDVFDTGIALPVGGNIGRREFDGIR